MKSCRELAPLCTIPPLPTSSVGAPRHIRKAAATTAIANIPIDQYVLGRASSTARPRTITAVDDRLQFFPVLAADSDLAAGSTASAQDTFYVGNLKGVGRVYQQTFIDTYSKVACAKLYDRKTPITAADMAAAHAPRTATPPPRRSVS